MVQRSNKKYFYFVIALAVILLGSIVYTAIIIWEVEPLYSHVRPGFVTRDTQEIWMTKPNGTQQIWIDIRSDSQLEENSLRMTIGGTQIALTKDSFGLRSLLNIHLIPAGERISAHIESGRRVTIQVIITYSDAKNAILRQTTDQYRIDERNGVGLFMVIFAGLMALSALLIVIILVRYARKKRALILFSAATSA